MSLNIFFFQATLTTLPYECPPSHLFYEVFSCLSSNSKIFTWKNSKPLRCGLQVHFLIYYLTLDEVRDLSCKTRINFCAVNIAGLLFPLTWATTRRSFPPQRLGGWGSVSLAPLCSVACPWRSGAHREFMFRCSMRCLQTGLPTHASVPLITALTRPSGSQGPGPLGEL